MGRTTILTNCKAKSSSSRRRAAVADLVDCFACGLAASSAPVVHMIASGFEATPGWADAALARFAEADVAAVAPVVVDRDNPDRILSAGLRWTAAGSIGRIAAGKRLDRFAANDRVLCGPELAVAFYRRDVLEAVETLQHHGSELAAATELALAMRKAGYRAVQEPACVTTATGELACFRRRLAGRRCRRAAFPSLDGGSRLETLLGRTCRAGGHGVPAVSAAALDPCTPRRSLAGPRWVSAAPRPVAIGPQVALGQEEAVIRPPHFGAAESRPAMQSRAAG